MDIQVVKGTVFGVSSDARHAFSKPCKESITLVEGYGVEGDAHAGPFVRHRFLARRWSKLANLRQVHLIAAELFGELREAGHTVGPGELGENVTTAGLKLEHLPLGTKLLLGRSAIVELTGLRTPCALIDRFQRGLRGKMIRGERSGPKFKCGVLGVVRVGGRVSAGDVALAEPPPMPWYSLPNL